MSWLMALLAFLPWFGPERSSFTDIVWSCNPPTWTSGPEIVNGEFRGTIDAFCNFEAISGEGFPGLRKHLFAKIPGDAETVHSGPNSETFENMPSTHYDITARVEQDGDVVVVRADTHVATDDKLRLIYTLTSSSVQGTGQSKYLRQIGWRNVIEASPELPKYTVLASMSIVIEKPFLIPGGIFKSQVAKRIEQGIPKQEEELITEAANHL